MIGIYKITNKLNGKCYIGQSVDMKKRLNQHKSNIKYSNISWYPKARKESNSIKDFAFEVVEECKKDMLDEREKYWIKYYDSYKCGYNLTEDGKFHGVFTGERNSITLKWNGNKNRSENDNTIPLPLLQFVFNTFSGKEGLKIKLIIALFQMEKNELVDEEKMCNFIGIDITKNRNNARSYYRARNELCNMGWISIEPHKSIIINYDFLWQEISKTSLYFYNK